MMSRTIWLLRASLVCTTRALHQDTSANSRSQRHKNSVSLLQSPRSLLYQRSCDVSLCEGSNSNSISVSSPQGFQLVSDVIAKMHLSGSDSNNSPCCPIYI